MRSSLNDVLGHVVHARISMDSLKETILYEFRIGEPPTYRGKELNGNQIRALEGAAFAIETAFNLLKSAQWPEIKSRFEEGMAMLEATSSLASSPSTPTPPRLPQETR